MFKHIFQLPVRKTHSNYSSKICIEKLIVKSEKKTLKNRVSIESIKLFFFSLHQYFISPNIPSTFKCT